jgi:trk system potassium uptake protein TrkH
MPSTLTSQRARWLLAARLCGVWAMSVIAQIAVDMPDGYFGPLDVVTPFGALYAALLTVLTIALVAGAGARPRWTAWAVPPAVPLLLAANVGLFVPALASDPVVAGAAILWNLTLLAQQLFPTAHRRLRSSAAADTAAGWLVRRGPALRHLVGASLVLTVAVVGYRLSGRLLAQGICLLLQGATLALAWPLLRLLHRAGRRSPWIIAVPVAASLLAAGTAPAAMLSLLAVAQLALLLVLLGQQQSTLEVLRDFYRRPSWLIFASFASVIVIGTVLLTFPAASAGPTPVSPLDALFTATSATCVTGLIVLDTPNDLSLLGQGIVLALIQVGGLGIMVVSTFATLLLGGSLGLRGEQALSEMLDLGTASTAYRLTRFIVLSTLAVEGAGALLLTFFFWGQDGVAGLGGAIWRGVFHAVSAFCNAGFALQTDSLVSLQGSTGAVLVFAALIVLGGLGFGVLSALLARLGGRRGNPVSTQVKVVLAISAVLVVAGFALYALLEWNRTLAGLGVGGKLANALFQSVTLRTAGFNSVDFAALAPATVLFMMLFMFIGASPGSTGGGIKTTTLAVLLAALRSTVKPQEPVRLFDREIPEDVVFRSLAIVVISVLLVACGLFALLLCESQPFLTLAFEVVSAFGTVGLSLGATAQLGPVGKLFIIVVMFAGRIGPLTLALLLGTGGSRGAVCRYPRSRLMVG